MRKILFDTDIGSDIDDALALLLLLHLPDIELVGITTVYGHVDIRAKVAKKILDAAGISVPVFAGESVPLNSPQPIWHTGTEGHGVLDENEFAAPLGMFDIGKGADEFIIDTITANRGEITMVALGALTNVARAIRKKPEICSWMNGFYFMGGGVTYRDPIPLQLEEGKSYSSRPSHNVRCDVEAARIVFASDLPIHVLTNDVTTRLWWDGVAVQNLIQSRTPPENVVVGNLLRIWLNYRAAIFGQDITGTCPHDPLTIAEAAGHSFVTYMPGRMVIHKTARTIFIPSTNGRHYGGVDVDSDRFLNWFSRFIHKKIH